MPVKYFSDYAASLQDSFNALYREKTARLRRGQPVWDLVSGNVTEQGLQFPPGLLQRALADGAARTAVYRPDPKGALPARLAVSDHYRERGADVPAERVVLTPGTSLAYAYLFRLLADSGGEFLGPAPSYPLFDSLAGFAGVRLVSYPLVESEGWRIDLSALADRITDRTRGILLVSPHNPTGRIAGADDLAELARIAGTRRIPVIADEVFAPFFHGSSAPPTPAGMRAPLVFTLNGISKMMALPGLKLGWIAVTGEPDLAGPALRALEVMADHFLPVSEPVQAALPMLLTESREFRASYAQTIRDRARTTLNILKPCRGLEFHEPEGGFYAIARLRPSGADEQASALELLKKEGILVHPGYFYEAEGQHLVFSLVQDPAGMAAVWKKLVRFIEPGFSQPRR